jgi:uncharacterized protein YdeI (YjbR/CyaY-like superfamily)
VPPASDYPTLHFPTRAAFRKWLAAHHASQPGVWLQIARAGATRKSVTYADALDVALCFGWIDGQKKSHDADSFLQKFTPRQKRSPWSKRNREHVARLIAAGEMHAAGLAAIEAAKADGRWDRAYDSPSTVKVPDDLRAALDANPAAKAFFATLNGANRYAILYRIQTAVKPETRARRIADFVAMLKRREMLHP